MFFLAFEPVVCYVVDALDGAEDHAVWDNEEGETEDAEEPSIDNEFETESKAVNCKSEKVNNQRFSLFLHLPLFIYILRSVKF